MFRFLVATDCFVETCLVTDRFGGLIPNSGWWSSRDRRLCELGSRKLTQEIRIRLQFQRQVSGSHFKHLVDRT